MKVTIFHQQPTNLLAYSLLEKHIVRYDHRRPSAWLQDVHHMLDEVELLISCLHREVVPARRLARSFCTKRWISHHNIVSLRCVRAFGQRIYVVDIGLNLMEIKIHQGKASGI